MLPISLAANENESEFASSRIIAWAVREYPSYKRSVEIRVISQMIPTAACVVSLWLIVGSMTLSFLGV
jgi:hypothetical protein